MITHKIHMKYAILPIDKRYDMCYNIYGKSIEKKVSQTGRPFTMKTKRESDGKFAITTFAKVKQYESCANDRSVFATICDSVNADGWLYSAPRPVLLVGTSAAKWRTWLIYSTYNPSPSQCLFQSTFSGFESPPTLYLYFQKEKIVCRR